MALDPGIRQRLVDVEEDDRGNLNFLSRLLAEIWIWRTLLMRVQKEGKKLLLERRKRGNLVM